MIFFFFFFFFPPPPLYFFGGAQGGGGGISFSSYLITEVYAPLREITMPRERSTLRELHVLDVDDVDLPIHVPKN